MTLSCQTARLMVSDYFNGEFDAEAAKLLDAHLRTCRNCAPLYAALVTVRRRLHRMLAPALPSSTRLRLFAQVTGLPVAQDTDRQPETET